MMANRRITIEIVTHDDREMEALHLDIMGSEAFQKFLNDFPPTELHIFVTDSPHGD